MAVRCDRLSFSNLNETYEISDVAANESHCHRTNVANFFVENHNPESYTVADVYSGECGFPKRHIFRTQSHESAFMHADSYVDFHSSFDADGGGHRALQRCIYSPCPTLCEAMRPTSPPRSAASPAPGVILRERMTPGATIELREYDGNVPRR
jgi:hypothetical protein